MRVSSKFPSRAVVLVLFVALPLAGQQEPPSVAGDPEHTIAVASPATSAPDLTTGADGKLSQEQMRQLFRVVADKDIENEKHQRDYTYTDREVEPKLDG